MSTVSSVQSYGSPLYRPEAQRSVEPPNVGEGGRDASAAASRPAEPRLREDRDRTSPSSARPDPASVTSRIDDLIASQVSSGTLTSDQANALKTAFAAAAPGGPDPAGGPRAADASEAPPPPPAASITPDGTATSRAGQGRDTGETDRDALVRQFVEQLRQNSAAGYAAGGAPTRTARALVFDISA